MSKSNSEVQFKQIWSNYSCCEFGFNPAHEEYKTYLDNYKDSRRIYEELLKLREKVYSQHDQFCALEFLAEWLCDGIEQSLLISESTRDSKNAAEQIKALKSQQKAFTDLLEANKKVNKLMGQQKIGTPHQRSPNAIEFKQKTVSSELGYLAEVAARPLLTLEIDQKWLNRFGQSGRDNPEIVRFGKSLSLYFYESIGMKLDGTVAHITNAMFSLPNENYGELLSRDSVREWTKGFN